jgi:putative tricarboxylic transport membrane protein
MIRIRDPKNFGCAALFVALAVVLALSALSLPIGTASQMGAGYFPLALALILGALGLILAVTSLRIKGPGVAHFEWRGMALVTLAIVVFAGTITRLGFLPAVTIVVGISTLASTRFRRWSAIALTTFLVAFCWAVFVLGLGLPVRLIAW